ncbi:MAG TPA: D-alanyl-D-alanine carboxypeptidase family protein [Kofleriaceae bacterium]|nr:D-alanyl-D-alanine carboxypeptidase family protein [Kofleriaceae bacterium]
MGVFASGCGIDDGEQYSQVESFATVTSYETSTCSTSVVIGLSKQIADEIGCASPTGLVKFTAGGKLTITSNSVLPYLAANAKQDLMDVAANNTVQVNSAFRTVAQQYLLYRWYQLGRCGITAAATPGNSNHESGRALDIANYSSIISAMGGQGWSHDVPNDPVHFDHLSSPDIRGRDVLAFQKLWNRNHPTDAIAEDGDYGPMTEARLKKAPSEGFAIGPTCLQGTRDLDVVSVNGPDRASPQTRVHYAITVKNAGTANWPATTKLQLKSATSSQLYDESWTSQTVITTLGAAIEAGKSGTIDLDVTTPATDVDLPIMEELTLNDGGTKFGDIQLALTVVPGMSGDESGDGNEMPDPADDGGCNAGGNASWFALLALVGLRRRRR